MMNVTEGNNIFGKGGRLYSEQNGKPKRHRQDVKWRDLITTAMEIAGVASVAYGSFQIYEPAGWLVGGAALIALGFAAGVDR